MTGAQQEFPVSSGLASQLLVQCHRSPRSGSDFFAVERVEQCAVTLDDGGRRNRPLDVSSPFSKENSSGARAQRRTCA